MILVNPRHHQQNNLSRSLSIQSHLNELLKIKAEKATYFVIAFTWHFGKGKTRPGVSRDHWVGEEGIDREGA